MKSELRRFLEEELEAIGESAGSMEKETPAFWNHEEEPGLAMWSDLPVSEDMAEPGEGTVSERELYFQVVRTVKLALASRQ